MATKAASAKMTPEKIVSLYMDEVLEHEVAPKSVFKFCKSNKIKEEDFYRFFGSFEGLQKEIWRLFFTHTEKLLQKDKSYASYTVREKLLTFFYTFFENLSLNRSYVLFVLDSGNSPLEHHKQLLGLRSSVKDFAAELAEENNEDKLTRLSKARPQLVSEAVWVQLILLLKFWINDSSPGFEKTDLAIEKSVNTVFDLFDTTPLDSLFDLGKFLYKEFK
jgi:AcrR family transcriptional regulator